MQAPAIGLCIIDSYPKGYNNKSSYDLNSNEDVY